MVSEKTQNKPPYSLSRWHVSIVASCGIKYKINEILNKKSYSEGWYEWYRRKPQKSAMKLICPIRRY